MIHFDKLFAMKMVIIKVILLRGDATETGKGQIISKALFGNLEFSQKRNERIRRSSKNEFIRSFFGRIRGCQKSFRNYLTFRRTKFQELRRLCSWKENVNRQPKATSTFYPFHLLPVSVASPINNSAY